MELSYEQLVARAKSGDEQAVVDLVELCGADIRRTARALLGPLLRPYVDTVDVAQSVQLAIVMGLRDDTLDIADSHKLTALATRMVQRKVADHWRRISRRNRLLSAGIDRGDLVALLSSACSRADDPAAIAEFNDQLEHLLSGLDERQRQVLELRLLGYSTSDVANALGLDADVLRAQLSRLRKKLRDKKLLSDWI